MILGIENRTENWKTARTLAPLLGDGSVRLANRLLQPLNESVVLQACDVRLELFWKGMRDYIHQFKEKAYEGNKKAQVPRKKSDVAKTLDNYFCEKLANTYNCYFPTLHEDVEEFRQSRSKTLNLRCLKDWNYKVSKENGNSQNLFNNLLNTEIDIVLDSPKHLFIGEAKHEMGFGADAKLVLVHQLIRQYVTARILAEICEPKKTVVPFIVRDKKEDAKRAVQVQFMVCKGWLKEENILRWEDIEKLYRA